MLPLFFSELTLVLVVYLIVYLCPCLFVLVTNLTKLNIIVFLFEFFIQLVSVFLYLLLYLLVWVQFLFA